MVPPAESLERAMCRIEAERAYDEGLGTRELLREIANLESITDAATGPTDDAGADRPPWSRPQREGSADAAGPSRSRVQRLRADVETLCREMRSLGAPEREDAGAGREADAAASGTADGEDDRNSPGRDRYP